MYRIISDGVFVGECDSVESIKLNRQNQCYNLCDPDEAEGFVCKLTLDEAVGETDVVFVLDGKTMKGGEPVGEYIWTDEPLDPELTDAEVVAALEGIR